MPLDADDLKKIQEMIGGVAALVAPENLAKVITPILDAQNKAAGVLTKADLDKRDADARKAAEDKAKADADAAAAAKAAEDAKKGGKNDPPAVDPKVAELEKSLAALRAEAEQAKAAAAAAAEKARTDALHNSAASALRKAGVPEDRIPLAMSRVKDLGVLTHDGERPGWKGTDPKTNTPAVLDIEAAAKSWAESAEGKVFLPPAGGAGTGEGGGKRATAPPLSSPLRDGSGALNVDAAADRFLANLGR